MNSKVAKDLALTTVIGAAYYFLYINLVGIAAAIAFPEEYARFAREHMTLSLIIFYMVTTVPAAALAAILAGYSVVRLVSNHRIWWAVAIVVGATLYSAYQFGMNGRFVPSLTAFVLPSSVVDVPMVIAWWMFLPLSVALFAWRYAARDG